MNPLTNAVLTSGAINYRSLAQLSDQVWKMSQHLPKDIELVVGVPRSGLLVANLLALYLNRPMTDVEGLIAGRLLTAGPRYRKGAAELSGPDGMNVLVVDDSVRTGAALAAVKRQIAEAKLPHRVQYAAVYVLPTEESVVDFHCESLPVPRFFEWNIFHSRLNSVCMDIDGVLCRNPTREENDDGPAYTQFLGCADPSYLPTEKVGWLVTCRLEKYRSQTEDWLAEWGVKYGELIMLDLPEARVRRQLRPNGQFKAEVYRYTGADMFFESSLTQSVQIANLAMKPVFCVDTRQMVYPESTPRDRFVLVRFEDRPRLAQSAKRRVRKMLADMGLL